MNKGFAIAIDGPVASGKGTLAGVLADKLNGFFVNTGNMYRSVALLVQEKGLDVNNEDEVAKVLPEINIEFKENGIFLNERDITELIKAPEIAAKSSVVASYPKVREDLVRKQQEIANRIIAGGRIVIVEGRDIGTKVLPNADIKIFMTADPEVRAKRRHEQYLAKGLNEDYQKILEDTRLRDERDMNRSVDPLPSNPEELGYWVLDNSEQTEEQSIDLIIGELQKRNLI